jgi:hypothetical protein
MAHKRDNIEHKSRTDQSQIFNTFGCLQYKSNLFIEPNVITLIIGFADLGG